MLLWKVPGPYKLVSVDLDVDWQVMVCNKNNHHDVAQDDCTLVPYVLFCLLSE